MKDENITPEYINKQQDIDANKNMIISMRKEIAQIDLLLKSNAFKFTSFFGLGASDLKSEDFTLNLDDVLPKLANQGLSKNDLLRKKSIFEAQITQLSEEIKGWQAALRQLRLNAQDEELKFKAKQKTDQNSEFLVKYKADPNNYLAIVVSTAPKELHGEKSNLYACADQIIAVCGNLDQKTEKAHLYQAWKILSAARDLAIAEEQDPLLKQQYIAGAAKMFQRLVKLMVEDEQLIKLIPEDLKLQDMQVIYDEKQYAKIDSYVEKILLKDMLKDPEKINLLRADIEEQKSIVNKRELAAMALPGRKRKWAAIADRLGVKRRNAKP